MTVPAVCLTRSREDAKHAPHPGIDRGIIRRHIPCREPERNIRTTIALDDDLVATARRYTGIKEKSALVREALKALIEREAARRLARLGGSDPHASAAPRRRFE